ncbi:hypothetical protein QYE76_067925 [Lolium multiflorum]|uniref:Retrotransposon protein, putative, Ty1-copia subclass n=1 Tax=Lolium multiflorum TaxID=4521 RepID=A0AAD8WC47_LOLMU|nr:hypothetical protein QYE76_067925 [Lolium multiflorum]
MHYKRWRTKAVLWFTNIGCFSATDARPEGPLSAEEQEKFEKVDAMFKAALFSILGDNIVDPYMAFDHGKDVWDALEAKFGVSDAGTELYVMEQYYNYRMTDERSVVEHAHEIQSLAKELEQFKCTLPDKFVAGGIIAKLPPSWRNFATSLKHKRRVSDLIGSLHVEEKARAKDTCARSFEGGSSANVVQKKNFQSHKSNNKNNGKGKFDEKNKASNSTNFKRKTPYKKKGNCPEHHDRRGNSGKSANVVIGVDTEMKDVGYGIYPTVLSVARTCSVLMGNDSRAPDRGVGTASYGIHYTGYPRVLEGYSDANWISDADETKATSGYLFTLGGGAVSWKSCKQTIITRSTMEAELTTLDTATVEAEWLRELLMYLPVVLGALRRDYWHHDVVSDDEFLHTDNFFPDLSDFFDNLNMGGNNRCCEM